MIDHKQKSAHTKGISFLTFFASVENRDLFRGKLWRLLVENKLCSLVSFFSILYQRQKKQGYLDAWLNDVVLDTFVPFQGFSELTVIFAFCIQYSLHWPLLDSWLPLTYYIYWSNWVIHQCKCSLYMFWSSFFVPIINSVMNM